MELQQEKMKLLSLIEGEFKAIDQIDSNNNSRRDHLSFREAALASNLGIWLATVSNNPGYHGSDKGMYSVYETSQIRWRDVVDSGEKRGSQERLLSELTTSSETTYIISPRYGAKQAEIHEQLKEYAVQVHIEDEQGMDEMAVAVLDGVKYQYYENKWNEFYNTINNESNRMISLAKNLFDNEDFGNAIENALLNQNIDTKQVFRDAMDSFNEITSEETFKEEKTMSDKQKKERTFFSVSERAITYMDSKEAKEKDGSPLKLARILVPSQEGYKESLGEGVSFIVPAFLVSDGKFPVQGRKLVGIDTDRPVQISIPHKQEDNTIEYETKEISAVTLKNAFTKEKEKSIYINVSEKQITYVEAKEKKDKDGNPLKYARILIPSQEGYKRHIGEGASFLVPAFLVTDGRYVSEGRKLLNLEPGREIEVSIPEGDNGYRKEKFKAEEIKEAFTKGQPEIVKDKPKETER